MRRLNLQFEPLVLESLVGGLKILDFPRLDVQSLDEAENFIRAYGYSPDDPKDLNKMWNYHRRAVTFIQTHLLQEGEAVPELLADPNQLKELSYLLIYASTRGTKEKSLQNWACGILKVIHVLVHLDNDLFTSYSSEIQDQVLGSYREHIYNDLSSGMIYLGSPSDPDSLVLKKFDIKPLKTSTSSITKLLAKPEEVAFAIMDKMGVRFVTRHLIDCFRTMRYLIKKNVISFPHLVPNQSTNNLYPLNLFLEVIESLTDDAELSEKQIDEMLYKKIYSDSERAQFLRKENLVSSSSYRFIKFITRKIVKIDAPQGGRPLSFFYPYEVQIVDYETYLQQLSGPASHEEYKTRQQQKARERVFGWAKEKASTILSFIAAATISLSSTIYSVNPAFALPVSENLGQLKLTDLLLRPEFRYQDQSESSGFLFDQSQVGLLWTFKQDLSAIIRLGNETLLARPRYFDESTDTDSWGVVEAYGRLQTVYGSFEAGLIPLQFGADGSVHETQLVFSRPLLQREGLVALRDIGFRYSIENKGFFTDFTLHNGEAGDQSDSRFFLSSKWGWRSEKRQFRGGLLGQVGRTKAAVTETTGRMLGGAPNTEDSLIRMGGLFVRFEKKKWLILLDAIVGEILQDKLLYNKFSTGHLDFFWTPKPWGSLQVRYDYFDPDHKRAVDLRQKITGGFHLHDAQKTNSLILNYTHVLPEDGAQREDRLLLSWRITPVLTP